MSVVAGERRATMVDVATTDTGTLPPVTQTRLTITAASIAQSGYTPQLLASMLHLGYSTDSSTYTAQRWTVTADGSLTMGFPARRWAPPGGTFSESLKLTADWGLPSGEVMVDLQSFGADGKLYAGSLASVFVGAFQVPAYLRGVVFGRDSNGELWRYEATPDPDRPGRFAPPVLVGQGWNAYSALTPLGLLKADNTGGGLVARDRSGVLWFYRSNGAAGGSFAPRTRVGTGWNTYNSLVGAGDVTGDGHADLLGRDSAGVLWLYRGTGSATAPLVSSRVRVGGGWLGYKSLIGAGDVTGDGRGDLLAVDAAGKMWLYASTGNSAAPYRSRVQVGTGWQIYNRIVGVADMTGDGHPDLLARDPAGRLWYYRGTGNPVAPYAGRVQSDTGWSGYDVVF
ncbi:N-acetylmuramoyl-L-alanine amidase [Actinacidiphila cocklensis]|uniref:N-acetylmuramoyl-L-alanine amidase n=1 Tax=Actinacidiphila cocklensis TaxID=887465 RepID=A0A9W4E5T9_9ACTN|nr:N-acetylmuramoyl-L-alanine amidase [Actinacidiphila cocklensis]